MLQQYFDSFTTKSDADVMCIMKLHYTAVNNNGNYTEHFLQLFKVKALTELNTIIIYFTLK